MLKKMIVLSLGVLLSLFFSGCSSKKELVTVYETKYICTKQSLFTQPKLNIYIAKEDIENAEYYKELNNLAYKNYQKQVIENNRICEKFKEKENVR